MNTDENKDEARSIWAPMLEVELIGIGQKRLRGFALLDTGSNAHILSEKAAAFLGYQPTGYTDNFSASGDKPTRQFYTRGAFRAIADPGNKVFDLQMTVISLRPAATFQCILGLQFLSRFYVSLSSQSNVVRLDDLA